MVVSSALFVRWIWSLENRIKTKKDPQTNLTALFGPCCFLLVGLDLGNPLCGFLRVVWFVPPRFSFQPDAASLQPRNSMHLGLGILRSLQSTACTPACLGNRTNRSSESEFGLVSGNIAGPGHFRRALCVLFFFGEGGWSGTMFLWGIFVFGRIPFFLFSPGVGPGVVVLFVPLGGILQLTRLKQATLFARRSKKSYVSLGLKPSPSRQNTKKYFEGSSFLGDPVSDGITSFLVSWGSRPLDLSFSRASRSGSASEGLPGRRFFAGCASAHANFLR